MESSDSIKKSSKKAHHQDVQNLEYNHESRFNFMLLWMLVWGLFWCHLGVHLGSSWGQLGVHLGSQERLQLKTPFHCLFASMSDPSWTPSLPQLGGLGASWGGLGPLYFPSSFQCFVKPYFESISDPKTTLKSIKNRSEIHAKIKVGKRSHFKCSSIKF